MQPASELVALAREFHELGGTEGILCNEDRLILDSKTGNVFRVDWEVKHGIDIDYADAYWIPILTESELWAWLRANITNGQTLKATQRGFFQADQWQLVVQVDGGKYTYFAIKDSLHHTLYTAAVWVAKEKHDNR